jgi:hypothetical protein
MPLLLQELLLFSVVFILFRNSLYSFIFTVPNLDTINPVLKRLKMYYEVSVVQSINFFDIPLKRLL